MNDKIFEWLDNNAAGLVVLLVVLLVPVAVALGIYCNVMYWNAPILEVPYMCHAGR